MTTHGKTHGTDLSTQICEHVLLFKHVQMKSGLWSFCTESMKQAWLLNWDFMTLGLVSDDGAKGQFSTHLRRPNDVCVCVCVKREVPGIKKNRACLVFSCP